MYGIDTRELSVVQNTVVMSRAPAAEGTVVLVHDRVHGISIRNNLLVSGGYPLVTSEAGRDRVVFQGNQYHAARGPWTVRWLDSVYADLESWRDSTGQERVGSRATGTSADPCPRGGALPDVDSARDARLVVPRCPVEGLDLRRLFGVDPGPVDYFGRALPTPPAVGAAQP